MEHPSSDGWSVRNPLSASLRACSVPNSTGEFREVSQASCSVRCQQGHADKKSSHFLDRKEKQLQRAEGESTAAPAAHGAGDRKSFASREDAQPKLLPRLWLSSGPLVFVLPGRQIPAELGQQGLARQDGVDADCRSIQGRRVCPGFAWGPPGTLLTESGA